MNARPSAGKIIDLFCGGGGASYGLHRGLGRAPSVAVNHCEHAIAMHAANHPGTIHLREDVFAVDPLAYGRIGRVDALWASPDCTHFSRAKGATPRSQKIRSLGWAVVDWARAVAPRVIFVENVPEFITWGPLHPSDHPDPKLRDQPIAERRGETFREWVNALKLAGYTVEWRKLRACDYGTPTTRERLYVVARCDGRPIVWPKPTHGNARARAANPELAPWRTAAECIDWTIPCPSIFMDRAEAKAWAREMRKTHPATGLPKRPLSLATQRRIAEGIRRFVLNGDPFLVNLSHGGRLEDLGRPANTITATPNGGDRALVAPVLAHLTHGVRFHDVEEPVRTITAAHRGEQAVIAPVLINTRNGERSNQAPRARDVSEPYLTITGQGSQGAIAAVSLAKHYGGVVGHLPDRPLGTVTAIDHHSVVAANIVKMYGTSTATPMDEPLHTVTGQGGKHALVAAFLLKFYSQGGQWSKCDAPMDTIVAKARMGLVTVEIEGETYAIVDIGMRMLTPRELARAQGFPDSYVLIGTKEQQIARIGNSVCPQVAEALARANVVADDDAAPAPRRRRSKRVVRDDGAAA